MSTKHVRTATDLVRFKLGLSVECLACSRVLTHEGYEVVKEVGSLQLRSLEPRLKCSHCGAKKVRMSILHPPQR
jgi:hypothetical protein